MTAPAYVPPREPLLRLTSVGLYCPAGDFYIDPQRRVERAVTTHAHADHARPGMGAYLATRASEELLRRRLGRSIRLTALPYGRSLNLGGVRVSFHPAGHILGSAQVCLEFRGERWVVTGDYKLEADPTCEPFVPVRCHVFITETTFGLPVYRWLPQAVVFEQLNAWWRANREAGRVSVVYAYSLGKAQRILAGVDAGIGPLYVHSSVASMNEGYAAAGVALPAGIQVIRASQPPPAGALVVAPRNTEHARWMSRLPDVRTAFASGWVLVRRHRPAGDPGFVLSDHVDWPQLLAAVEASGADYVLATHGFEAEVVRYLRERGRRADVLGVLRLN